ncbi:UNVERIFIED_CONTAM: hypothetical protein Slati_2211900 [Sesamum latifolium]|uniref:DUF4283 domain-containing protein n=1 Tax=Sesamum latifolium TaxID=2727402 RepID=A0AAW2WT53_9LAMI
MMSANPLVWSVRKALRTLSLSSDGGDIESNGDSRVLEHGAATHNPNMHAPMENPNLHAPSTVAPTTLWRRRFCWHSWRRCQFWLVLHRPLIIRRSLQRLDHLGFLAILRLVRLFRRPVGLVLHRTFSVEVIPIRVLRCRGLRGRQAKQRNFSGVCSVACNEALNAAGQYLCRDIHYFLSENAALCPARSTERRDCYRGGNGGGVRRWSMALSGTTYCLTEVGTGMTLRKRSHTQVPIWIKLRHLPVELWTPDGLSTVASGVVRPLYPDVITKAGTRLDYARVCVLIDFSSTLPKYLIILAPDEDGGEHPCCVDIDYEWVPKNVDCRALGHSVTECPSRKKATRPPVTVFVQKPQPTAQTLAPVERVDPPTEQAVMRGPDRAPHG